MLRYGIVCSSLSLSLSLVLVLAWVKEGRAALERKGGLEGGDDPAGADC